MNRRIRWICWTALTTAFAAFAGGCAQESTKPCAGANCVSDAEITAAIKAEINQHAELTDWTIDVQTINGVVYLHGLVDTDPQRRLIEDIARETRGVMGVENGIELRNLR